MEDGDEYSELDEEVARANCIVNGQFPSDNPTSIVWPGIMLRSTLG
jgi:hypothetical protein